VIAKENLNIMKYKIRNCNPQLKEEIINTYAKSLLSYLGAPALAANLIKPKDLSKFEIKLFKVIHCCPRDIKG